MKESFGPESSKEKSEMVKAMQAIQTPTKTHKKHVHYIEPDKEFLCQILYYLHGFYSQYQMCILIYFCVAYMKCNPHLTSSAIFIPLFICIRELSPHHMIHGEDWVLVSGCVGDFTRDEGSFNFIPCFQLSKQVIFDFELVFAFCILSFILCQKSSFVTSYK